MLNDFRHEGVVFDLLVLPVEDAVFHAAQSDASEEILRADAGVAVIDVIISRPPSVDERAVRRRNQRHRLIGEGALIDDHIPVLTVRSIIPVRYVLAIRHVVAAEEILGVLAVFDVISGRVHIS